MSFDIIPPRAAPSANAVDPNKVMLSTRPNIHKTGFLAVFALGSAVVKKLNLNMAEPKVEIAWGRDVHTGKVRLRAAQTGGDAWKALVNKKARSARVTTGALPEDFDEREFKRLSIPFEILEDVRGGVPYLVATLPPGLVKSDED